MPRPRNPDVSDRLLDAAARVLSEEGRQAVTARRLASEIGTSTMALYTHFGSMDELLIALWRQGFARFGAALDTAPTTDDPVADWGAQGWAYRRFALDNRHLYRVMFGDGLAGFHGNDPADERAAMATFESLLTRLQRAADAGRLVIDDLQLAGQVVWSAVHGHMTIELTGFFESVGRDPVAVYAESLRRLGLAYGDDPEALDRSLAAVRPRRGGVSRASPRASERSSAVSRASPRASERSSAVNRASPRASERSSAVSRASPRASEGSSSVSRR